MVHKKKKSFFEGVRDELLENAQDYMETKVKRKLIRVGEMSFAFLFAGVLLVIGIAELLASFVPYFDTGLNYLVLGILFLFIGLLLK